MTDETLMAIALDAARLIGPSVSPNPGVGCAIRTARGEVFVGCTQPPGGAHAEVMAIQLAVKAGANLVGATLATTLEPCCFTGRTGPCTSAILNAGIGRVVIGILDPDPRVSGQGAALLAARLDVEIGIREVEIEDQLRQYTHHRKTGLPWVTLKLAASADGRTAAPDFTSKWITSTESRADSHRLRSMHDAILVGAATVRADDPDLRVRLVEGRDPLRVVLGEVEESAKINPCLCLRGPLPTVLKDLGTQGVLSVLVEGGSKVAHAFHSQCLVNEYVIYVAPMFFGGDDSAPVFSGAGASTISDVWRGEFRSVKKIGPDVRIVIGPAL